MKSLVLNYLTVENLAKITFLLFLFFIFFGTSVPFAERASDVDDLATSNPFKQLIFSTVYFLAFLAIIPKWRLILDIIVKEKYLTLFVLWTLLSFMWSDHPSVTFKRWIQLGGNFIVCLMVVAHFKSTKDIIKYFRAILLLYVSITFISVLVIPGASQMYHGAYVFRGLTPHKNQLGQSMLICTILFAYSINSSKPRLAIVDYFMLLISIFILLGSQSSTSIITCFIIGIIGLTAYIKNRFTNLGVGKWLLYGMITAVISTFILISYAYPSVLNQLFLYLEKDPTFTGRADLWKDLLEIQGNKIILGAGYGAFWVIGSSKMHFLYLIYIWLPRQAHNGYLDILLDTGFFGFALLVMIIISFFMRYIKNFINSDRIWMYFVLASLILNFQESSFFRGLSVVGVTFVFSYMFQASKMISHNNEE